MLDEIMRQKDAKLKEAVRASLAGNVKEAFEKLGNRVAQVNPDYLPGAAAARWLKLNPETRARAGLMAPSHALRADINVYIRERLARDGAIHGPRLEAERLVSRSYTKAEKMLAGNYSSGDLVSFHRAFKTLGVEKGDERRVAAVDDRVGKVLLEAPDGQHVEWRPRWVAAKRGAVEVYRSGALELRAGDRIRWTKNHDGMGLVNSHTAEVTSIGRDRVRFRLEDGRSLTLRRGDSQLRHLDHAWASTVHAFQGRTVDNVIAVMESRHPHLSTQKSFYVEISRARNRADLVTDDAEALREHLETATGERVAALEGIGAAVERPADRFEPGVLDRLFGQKDGPDRSNAPPEPSANQPAEQPVEPLPEKTPEPKQGQYDLEL
ncbi:MAG: hypothetical protein F4181_06760 [Proteobacteria bacterium]|nr:hypothetical protein [Pseudomonadota bacterium]